MRILHDNIVAISWAEISVEGNFAAQGDNGTYGNIRWSSNSQIVWLFASGTVLDVHPVSAHDLLVDLYTLTRHLDDLSIVLLFVFKQFFKCTQLGYVGKLR